MPTPVQAPTLQHGPRNCRSFLPPPTGIWSIDASRDGLEEVWLSVQEGHHRWPHPRHDHIATWGHKSKQAVSSAQGPRREVLMNLTRRSGFSKGCTRCGDFERPTAVGLPRRAHSVS